MGRFSTTSRTTIEHPDDKTLHKPLARRILFGALAALTAVMTALAGSTRPAVTAEVATAGPAGTAGQAERLTADRYPIQFEANVGQTDPRVAFLSRGPGYTLFLSSTESHLVMTDLEGSGASVRMTLLEASREARLVPEGTPTGVVNYYVGRDPSRWR